MTSKVQHRYRLTVNREDLGMKLSCLGREKKNGRTFGGTFYSFHDELLSKNIARRQLDGQHLLFLIWSIFADLNNLYLLNRHHRGELNIDEGKNV